MNLNIGQKIKYIKSYDVRCCHRFTRKTINEGLSPYIFEKYGPWELTPLYTGEPREGYVVGIRQVIMSNYNYHHSLEEDDDYEPAYSTGTKEEVALVIPHIRRKPFLVRYQDMVFVTMDQWPLANEELGKVGIDVQAIAAVNGL